MKIYLKFAMIPLALFIVLIGIPRLFAFFINGHTDVGIVALVTAVCLIFSIVVAKIYKGFVAFEKDYNDNELSLIHI